MNLEILRRYISEYERDFDRIHNLEIYKWRAVKQFQDHWNLDAGDFAKMLELSLAETDNLMAAKDYWPDKMIVANAERSSETVRGLFKDLFNEDYDLLERIVSFRTSIKQLNSVNFPGKSDYQDHRAVLVYLNLRYPETYYFYKYEMLKVVCEKLEYDYKPKTGSISNIVQYFNLCRLIKDEILLNNNLLKLHKDRLGKTEYFDREFNILTQDFIYAVAKHLALGEIPATTSPQLMLTDISLEPILKDYTNFKGTFIDHVSKYKRNKHIGDLGEQWVLNYEQNHCPSKYVKKVIPAAKSEGDGLGYDILSFDNHGNEKYIEVKTTTGGPKTSFFVSRVELERSKKEGNKYYLYRLYNFDEAKRTADCLVIRGDLSKYCINPTEYEIVPMLLP